MKKTNKRRKNKKKRKKQNKNKKRKRNKIKNNKNKKKKQSENKNKRKRKDEDRKTCQIAFANLKYDRYVAHQETATTTTNAHLVRSNRPSAKQQQQTCHGVNKR